MMLRSIRKLKNLKGKTVLLRADFNVPVTNGRVDASEDFRLERVVPTIKFLLRRGARVIILSHRGRPEGKVREDLRLAPVAKRLRKLLVKSRKSKVENQNIFQNSAFKILGALFPAYAIVPRVTMLENLRFDSREEATDAKFAKTLASLGDIYVNDAFAVSHRKNASVHAITKYLSSYAGVAYGGRAASSFFYFSEAIASTRSHFGRREDFNEDWTHRKIFTAYGSCAFGWRIGEHPFEGPGISSREVAG